MMGMGIETVGSRAREGALRRLTSHFEGPLAAYVGAALLLVGAISTYWDIATHIDVGRERFLTPAHMGIYSGVFISAIAIALSGLADHFRAGDSLFGAIRHPFRNLRPGIGVAGAGMLTTLVAAPFDNAWHEVYGIDVTIWSPPHLLAIFGIAAATLGLATLVAPAVTKRDSLAYPVLLAALLTALLITTGEFEFNAPQYRIAYHPIILAGATALVFTTAAGERWRATTAALWFEGVRVASLLFLIGVDRSLAFVPLVVPAAIVADLLVKKNVRRGLFMGVAVGVIAVVSNWVLLELLPGLRWPADDMLLGGPLAVAAGALAGWIGSRLGDRLEGEPPARSGFALRRSALAAGSSILLLVTVAPALAHEVGGKRGSGTIAWSPQIPEAGQTIDIEISDLLLDSGRSPEGLRVEAWRAEHRISVPIETTAGSQGRAAEMTLPEQGLWFLFVRAEAGGEHLLWGDHFSVADEGEGELGVHRQKFTLGVDTIAVDEPPGWVDAVAYGLAIALLLLLIRGVFKALGRLPYSRSPQEPHLTR
jgi:hypothetical protein